MELLIGPIVSFAVEGIKKLSKKYGVEHTKNALLLFVFMGVLGATMAREANLVSTETLAFMVKTFSMAIATYEIVVKRVVIPIFDALKKKS